MWFSKKDNLTTFYFFLLGSWTTILPMIVIWIAIDDILVGTLWSTALVLLAVSIPDILAKTFGPLIINRISFHVSFSLITIFYVGSILLLVIIDDVRVRMAGVTVLGLGYGFTMITCVRMIAYYEQAELLTNAFQNGYHSSALMASLGYTGMTTWICVAPRFAIAACIPICFMPLCTYILIDKEPLKEHLKGTARLVRYTKSKGEGCSSDEGKKSLPRPTPTLLLVYKSFPLVIYTYLSNFSVHFSMTAVLTTLTFPSSPFPPRDHFQYYRLLSDAGILLGGLGSFMFRCVGRKFNEFFGIRNIAGLVVVNVIHLLFFVLSSWYRFVHNVMPVMVLCLTQGIVHGLALVQSMICAANLFSRPHDKGNALSIVELGLSVGRIAAAFLGLIIERYLREHCTNNLLLGKYCLARISSSAGWSKNLICKN